MAVDLSTLIEPLKGKANPPGANLYPNSTDDQWLARLTDAFWSARLGGMLAGFEENVATRGGPTIYGEGIVTPLRAEENYDDPDGWSPKDMSRELQQLVVLWACWNVTLAKMQEVKTTLRTKAGPVEYEAQRSAQLLTEVLKNLRLEIEEAKKAVGRSAGTTRVFDAVISRTYAQYSGETWWLR